MGETTYGIEALKKVVKLVGDSALFTSDILDGFSIGDIGQALTVFSDLRKVLADKDLIIPEFKDLTAEEKSELTQYVAISVRFPKDVVIEGYIEKVLEFAISLSGLLQFFKN